MSTLPNVSPDLIQKYQEEIAKNSSEATAKRKSASLNKFFGWAEKEGHIEENPIQSDFAITPKPKKNNLKTFALLGTSFGLIVLIFLFVWKVGSPITFIQNFAAGTEENPITDVSGNTSPESTNSATIAVNPQWNLYANLKLTNTDGTPQVGAQTITFNVYNSKDGGTSLFTSDPQTITTDENGSALISLDKVPSDLFFQNNQLFLEPSVASNSASVRIPVSTANVAANLGGYLPANPNGATALTIPVIDSNGSLNLASESPAINAQSGNLLIQGQTLTMKTVDGGNGNIEINPDGSGYTHFLFEGSNGNFLNAQAPNLNKGSLYYGIVANNSTGYDLLKLQNGSKAVTRFSVDALGNTIASGNINAKGDLQTSGTSRVSSGGALQNITGYYQGSGNFVINQNGSDVAQITKTGSALNDVMDLTLDERGASNASNFSTLTLKRYNGNNDMAFLVDVGNAQFNGQLRLGRFDTNPAVPMGTGSMVYNTGDNKVYVWNGTVWQAVGAGSSGSSAFDAITSGTNTTATMTVGSGATLDYTGTGTINASSLGGATFASPGSIGSGTPGSGTFSSLTSNGTTTFGGIAYTWPGTQPAGNILQTNGAGALSWVDPSTLVAPSIYWNQNSGALFPKNSTVDVLIGSNATASAKFAFTGVDGGLPTASISGNVAGVSTYITGNGNLSTTAMSNLTVGGGSAGNVVINSRGSVALTANGLDLTAGGNLAVLGLTANKPVFTDGSKNLTSSGTVPVNQGGTGFSSYVVGDMLYADTTSTLAKLVDVATGNVILSGGVGTAPGYGKVILGTHTTGNYVSTVTGTPNEITSSGLTGDITISIPSDFRAPGTVNAVNGIYTGATAGTQRIDASGNLVNIGTTQLHGLTYTWPTTQSSSFVLSTDGAGALTWADPSVLTGGSNYWNLTDGALFPKNSSVDLLIGGNSTASAKFAVTGVNSGTPTATIAGSIANVATYLTGDGTLSTTNARDLTLGSSTTGNVVINSRGSSALTADGTSLTTGGTLTLPNSNTMTGVSNYLQLSNGVSVGGGTTYYFDKTGNINATGISGSSVTDTGLTASKVVFTDASKVLTSTGTVGANQGGTGFSTYAIGDMLYADTTSTLAQLADVATGNVLLSGGVGAAPGYGKVVLGTHTTGNYVSTITGTANQITASGSTGDITLSTPSDFRAPGTVNAVNGIYTGATAGTQRIDASGNLVNIGTTQLHGITYTWPAADAALSGYVLSSNGAGALSWVASGGVGTNYWDIANGALFPQNNTLDLLIGATGGATATTSAKFAFTGVNSGTPTASIAGTIANVATFIDGNGNISTTNRNNLTLGNSATYNTTNNILLNPNGTGKVGIGGTSPSALFSVGSSSQFQVDASGNANLAGTITLPNSNTLTGVSDYVELNNGVSVGGGTTYYFDKTGNINANTVATGTTQRIDASGNLTSIGTTQLNGNTYTWPASLPLAATGYYLTSNTTGTLAWTNTITASSLKWNSLTNPDGALTLAMGANATTFNWDSLTTGTGWTGASTSLSSGTLESLSVNSTAATGNTQKVLSLSSAGANATDAQTTYDLYATNTHTTSASTNTNIAGYFSASGGTANYAGIFDQGNVGIGTTTPAYKLDLATTVANDRGINIANTATTGTNYGIYSSVTGASTANYGGYFVSTGAATDYGLGIAALTGATSTGLDIGNLSGTTANKGINIGTISGTGATGVGVTVGNISSTGTTNYGINLGTMTGGTTSNYQIATGAITSATTTNNAQLNLGGITTTGGTNNYGVNIGALSGSGTTNYGINLAASTATGTTNYGIDVGNITGAASGNNYGLYIGTVSGANSNTAANNLALYSSSTAYSYFGGNVGIGDTTPAALLTVGNGDKFQVDSSGNIVSVGNITSTNTIFNLAIGNTGTINFTDGTNTFASIVDEGTVGRLAVSDALQVGGLTPLTYSRFGTATTGHSLSAAQDVLIGGNEELNGTLYLDGGIVADSLGTTTISLPADPTAVDSINFLTNGSWEVKNPTTGNPGIAALMVDQDKGGSIFTASASGTTKFLIANNGNVTITGSGTMLTVGGGTGKVDMGTIDPVYNIGGDKYATYLPGMTGVKEETTGQVATSEYIAGLGYRQVIDFKNLEPGSDNWLFGKATDISQNIDKMSVLLTPTDNTRTWYNIDKNNYTLSIYSSRPTQISYRLTAPRFDSELWTNINDNPDSTGFMIEDKNLTVNGNGNINGVTLPSLADYSVENGIDGYKIYQRIANGAKITIDEIAAYGAVVAAKMKVGSIQTAMISPLPDGTDVTVQIGSASESGKFAIQNSVGTEVASIDSAGNATFSGIVHSQNIDAIQTLLTQVTADQSVLLAATSGANLNASGSANISELIASDLYVTGQAAINSLSVTKSVTVGADMVISSIGTQMENGNWKMENTLNSLQGPLKIQSLAMAPVEIMGGLVTIDTHGNMQIAGNFKVGGNLDVAGKINTNEFEATGSALFRDVTMKGLTIASNGDATDSAVVNGVISTNATAGGTTIPAGVSEITIKNPQITDYTLVYVTPTSSTENNVLYVKSKEAGQFTVGFSNPISVDAKFNWWIVQIQ